MIAAHRRMRLARPVFGIVLSGRLTKLYLKSFAIYAIDGGGSRSPWPGNARAWTGYEEGIPGANRVLQAPTTGKRGRIAYNDRPASGADLGWVCVQSDTGIGNAMWKSIGTVSN